MAGPRLAGKVAIVTGAGLRAEGIGNGRATAVVFAREGARVLCVDQNKDAAEATRAMIAGEGGEAAVLAADVTRSGDCRAMVEEAVRRWGRLDILDNNVGIGGRATVVEVEEGDWDHMMRVNVTSMMLASKHAIPAMAKGGGGAIVNISSISALRPRGLTPYTVSKGAVIALTRAMAVDHAAQGIRVNCIAPGPVYTPMVYAAGMSPELRDQRRRAAPLGIEGTGWDIANAALFLASDEARWRRVMQVNVDSMFLMARQVIPALRQQGGGAIVNVSSISALRPRGLTAYTASKGAVIALTRAMAVDHGREGIRVNCVAPGPVYTPMVYAGGMTPAARELRKNASVLKREGTGWDIGHAVRFLLSDCARYITGQTLVVDGGASVSGPERATE